MLKRSQYVIQRFLTLQSSPRCSSDVRSFCYLKTVTKFQSLSNQWISIRLVGSSTASVEKTSPKRKDDLNFPEKTVCVYTCEDLYEQWKKRKRFLYSPECGVFAKIAYIDTQSPRLDSKQKDSPKTILCIHGIPGNYRVFTHLINELSQKGYRVVVPTFPGTLYLPGLYSESVLFRHTVEEKTQVFKDFLKTLEISKLECIIAHSSAIYPALRLILDPELEVKSQVFFNTGGHTKTVTMKPFPVVWVCANLYLHPLGRRFVRKTGKFILKYILRSPIKDDDFDGIMLLAVTMIFARYWEAKHQFMEIARRKIPTLYCFSEDDKVVERALTYKVVKLLSAHKENISFYDKDCNLERQGKDLNWLTLLSFASGSHYVFRKYPELCTEKVLEHLKKLEDRKPPQ